jgi:hypothetical protein
MKKRAAGFLIAVLASLTAANAQVVPVGGMGQHIIARNVVGIDCTTGQPTGFGSAVLYFPYIAGIPGQFLFKAGATVQDQTTAVITGVFSKVVTTQTTNYDMANVFLLPHTISYYYHPNSSPKDWTDFDGFQTGQLIGTYQFQMNMFTVAKGLSFVVNSGPWAFTADFVLPNGTKANLRNFMPGGITVHVFGELGQFVSATPGGAPQVTNLTTGTGPLVLGSCAVMSPFSGSGTNPGNQDSTRQLQGLDRPGGEVQ